VKSILRARLLLSQPDAPASPLMGPMLLARPAARRGTRVIAFTPAPLQARRIWRTTGQPQHSRASGPLGSLQKAFSFILALLLVTSGLCPGWLVW